MKFAATLAFAVLTVPSASMAQASALVSDDVTLAQRAEALSKILNSQENVIGGPADDEKALALVPELFGSKADLAELEARYPGISAELARVSLPIANRSMRQRLPELQRRQAALYASVFTADDMQALIGFYGSPAGQKFMRSMFANLKMKATMAEAKRSEDFTVSPESLLADAHESVPSIMRDLDSAEQRQLVAAFGRPGLMAKMKVMAPKTQAITLAWMDENVPGEDAEIDRAMEAVMQRRMGKE